MIGLCFHWISFDKVLCKKCFVQSVTIKPRTFWIIEGNVKGNKALRPSSHELFSSKASQRFWFLKQSAASEAAGQGLAPTRSTPTPAPWASVYYRNRTSGFLLTVLYSEGSSNRLFVEAARRKQDILKYVIKVNYCSQGAFKTSPSLFQATPSPFPGKPNFFELPLWSPHPPPKDTQLFFGSSPSRPTQRTFGMGSITDCPIGLLEKGLWSYKTKVRVVTPDNSPYSSLQLRVMNAKLQALPF